MNRLGIIAGICIALWLGWSWVMPSATLRYRLSLEAEVDGKPVSGSGVIEVRFTRLIRFLGSTSSSATDVSGEAVMLDLGKHGLLLSLLTAGSNVRSTPEELLFLALGYPHGFGSFEQTFKSYPYALNEAIRALSQGALSGKAILTPDKLPLLVRLRDLNDAKTVEKVDPTNLAASFGPGVKLTRATLEMVPVGIWPLNLIGITGEPVTRGIEGKVPALKNPDQWNAVLNALPWDANRLLPGSRALKRNF